jgi:hypothetical protein
MSLEFWSEFDYRTQWIAAIRRVLQGEIKSCLITSLTNPDTANFLFWWPIYRVGDEAILHNQVLILDDLVSRFDLNDPYSSLPERETVSDDGLPISEWVIPLSSFAAFLSRHGATI